MPAPPVSEVKKDAPGSGEGRPAAVTAAVRAGWTMAQLYHDVWPDVLKPPTRAQGAGALAPSPMPPVRALRRQLQADLPGRGDLAKAETRALLVGEIKVAVVQLSPVIADACLTVPDVPDVAGLARVTGAEGRYQLARAVLEFHIELLTALTSADATVGAAYGLGRAIADITLRPLAECQDSGSDWRALLTGEKNALDQLSASDYLDAAGYLLGRVRQMLQRLLGQYWIALAVVGLVVAASVVVSLSLFSTAAARASGVIVSVLGGFGITAKTVTSALQRAAGNAEQHLWQAELDLAVARAVTALPPDANPPTIGEPAVPRPITQRRRAKTLNRLSVATGTGPHGQASPVSPQGSESQPTHLP